MLTFSNRRCLPNSLRNFLKVHYYELDPKVFLNSELFGRRYQRQVKIWWHEFFAQPMKHANLPSFGEGINNKLIIWFEWGKTLTHTHTHIQCTCCTCAWDAQNSMVKAQPPGDIRMVVCSLVFRDHPKSAQNGFHFLFFFFYFGFKLHWFGGLAYQGKVYIVFRFNIEYRSLRDFGPY